jgi:predicted nucleic acid-binding protein
LVIVVDASLAVKWFLPEPGAEAAAALLLEQDEIVGPDMLAVEVHATLVRGANIVKSNRVEAETAIRRFQAMIESGEVTLIRSLPNQIEHSANLAMVLGHPLKDCIYLTLAMEMGCDLITCDARFAEKAKGVWARVRVLRSDEGQK